MLTYSLTARARHPGGDFYYRSAASAGALYPTEIYIAALSVNDLDDGLYHYSVAQHGLVLLRKGDLNSRITKIVPFMNSNDPTLIFFLSAVFFRSAWKYRDRSYRYDLLDTGHVAENMILTLRSLGISFTLSYDFDDHKANRLLGLDEQREVSLAVVSIEGRNDSNGESVYEISELPDEMKDASQVARAEKVYPVIQEIHRAGYRPDSTERSEDHMIHDLGVKPNEWEKIDTPETWPEKIDFTESVFARRSRRNFVRERISKDHAETLLNSLLTMDSKIIHTQERHRPIAIGMLSGDVEGFAPGFSLLEHSTKSIGMISKGHFLDKMAHICLDQQWLANAAFHFLFLADLEGLDRQWGARGYRYAMMEAGRLGERLYLAATAMGLGCCGIGAFFDGEAAELLGINKRSRLLYLVAVGPVKGGLH